MLKFLWPQLFAAWCAFAVAGCGAIAKDGPYSTTVAASASVTLPAAKPGDYALINLSANAVRIANATTSELSASFSDMANTPATPQARLAVGDILNLTIFEASSGGLFFPPDSVGGGSGRQGNYVQIPSQEVDAGGNITAPYAGVIRVVGRTPIQVAAEIKRRLADRAIEPEVIVSIADRRSSSVTVLGELGGQSQPERFQLDPGGLDILGGIARAGGPKYPAYETLVTLKRGGTEHQSTLTNIISHPEQDIMLTAGDVVYLSHKPRVFLVLGATPSPGSVGGINNRRFTFDDDTETLIEAVAKSGGLDDNRADPRSVYLFRLEARTTIHAMGVDLPGGSSELVPTIYTVNLAEPDGFFLSNGFLIRNADVVYVPNAPITDFNKFLAFFRNVTGPFYDLGESAGVINGIR